MAADAPRPPEPPPWQRWLEREVVRQAPPPEGFDPLRASAEELARFHLPQRPEAEAAPTLHEHWLEMLSPPRRFITPEFRTLARISPPPGRAFLRSGPVPTANRGLRSLNWSGALIRPNHGRRFTRLIGRWRAPIVTAGAGPSPAGLPFRCSVWLGLDGLFQWSRSLPQIGTDHTVDPSVPGGQVLRVWWQWWLRDVPPADQAGPQEIVNLPVRPGDVVLFDLTVESDTLVVFSAKNQGSGLFVMPILVPPPPVAVAVAPQGVRVEGSTAEWILERPHDPTANALFPLPDFTALGFDRSAGAMAMRPGQPAAELALRTARHLRMFERRDPPPALSTRVMTIAEPSRPPHPVRGERVNHKAP
jgi:hypothetical protein